jgi:hypothetical protein
MSEGGSTGTSPSVDKGKILSENDKQALAAGGSAVHRKSPKKMPLI